MWAIEVINGAESTVLPQWSGLRVEDSVTRPGNVTFNVPGDDDVLPLLRERQSDIRVYDRGRAWARYRLLDVDDDMDDIKYTVKVTAVDYREVLRHRLLHEDRLYLQVAQGEIAWDLVAWAQAQTSGNLGITRGTIDSVGIEGLRLRDRTYEPGDNIGDLLTKLGEVIDGFDWWIDPDLRFHVASPRRERYTQDVLEYGANVRKVTRRASADYANVVRYKGDLETAAVVASELPDPRGRWETERTDNDVSEQTTVAIKADGLLASLSPPRQEFRLTLAPGAWPDMDVRIGDVLPLRIRRGRLFTNTWVRVTELGISANPDGGEEVDIGALDEPYAESTLRAFVSVNERRDTMAAPGKHGPAGLIAWYDSSDSDWFDFQTPPWPEPQNTYIARWKDRSGYGEDLVPQVGIAKRAGSGVDFDGTAKLITSAIGLSGAQVSMMIVVQLDDRASTDTPSYHQPDNARIASFSTSASTVDHNAATTGLVYVPPGALTINGYRNSVLLSGQPWENNKTLCLFSIWNGTNHVMYKNNVAGAAVASAGTFNSQFFTVGGQASEVPVASGTVTNKVLTSNVVTLTTSGAHGRTVGQKVEVANVDSSMDGPRVITAVTSTTFSFAKEASDIASTAVNGTWTHYNASMIGTVFEIMIAEANWDATARTNLWNYARDKYNIVP